MFKIRLKERFEVMGGPLKYCLQIFYGNQKQYEKTHLNIFKGIVMNGSLRLFMIRKRQKKSKRDPALLFKNGT